MPRLRALPVALVTCALALTGCSNGGDTKKADSTPSPSASSTSSSPSPTESSSGSTTSPFPSNPPTSRKGPDFPHDRVEAASMHKAVLASSAAQSPDEKAAVAAWMDYWQGAADTYYFYKPTGKFLGVARGTAKSSVLKYMSDLKSQDQRVVGWAKDNVTKVKVSGSTATVNDCTENFTYTVDREIEPLTRPTPYYQVTGTLTKEGGRWTVTHQDSKSLTKSCL
jgi:hypothetical protein